jgi:hypothetical protein
MSEFLDIRTLCFITGATALAMFLCMLHVAIRRNIYPGFRRWTAAALASSAGFLLISFRHYLPDAGTVVAANTLIGLGSLLLYRGMRSFVNARGGAWLDYTALAALVVSMAYFTHILPDVNARILAISLFQAIYYLGAVRLTAGPLKGILGENNYLLLLSLLGASLWLILRGISTWLWGGHIPDFMASGALQGLSFVVFLTCNIMIMGGLISITSKRTENDLLSAKEEIKSLRDFLPICANCKKIRDDQGYWQQVENYIAEQTGAELTHGICPDCMKKLYPELGNKI